MFMGKQCLKRLLRNVRRVSVAAITTLLCLAMLGGCGSPPGYEVDSYEQIQSELAGRSGIIYPDISKYQLDGLTYWVSYAGGGCSKMEKTSYHIYSTYDYLEGSDADTVFSYFSMSCFDIDYMGDERNPRRVLQPNMMYRGIGMECYETNLTNDDDGSPAEFLPDGAELGSVICEFELNGYWYSFDPHFLLTADELMGTSFEQELSKAKSELFVVIDDILDKGGVPR
jgi:hypothetical protein